MSLTNRTLLLALLAPRCRQILEDAAAPGAHVRPINATASNATDAAAYPPTPSGSRASYDNAYFYILFVMVFYSFLAMALFKCLGSDEDRKDPYEDCEDEESGL